MKDLVHEKLLNYTITWTAEIKLCSENESARKEGIFLLENIQND